LGNKIKLWVVWREEKFKQMDKKGDDSILDKDKTRLVKNWSVLKEKPGGKVLSVLAEIFAP